MSASSSFTRCLRSFSAAFACARFSSVGGSHTFNQLFVPSETAGMTGRVHRQRTKLVVLLLQDGLVSVRIENVVDELELGA
jgi:hypothetical protein